MIGLYLTDKIDLIQTSYNEYGKATETTIASDLDCRIEDTNDLINDNNGKEVKSNMTVIIEPREIKPQWKIKIKKKNGRNYYMPLKAWEILNFENLNMMGIESHIEIRL